jgi:hypothetical protein
MNRNKILIITGVLIAAILIFILFWLQNIQGDGSKIENTYTIVIENCEQIADSNSIVSEIKAILSPTELKEKNDGSFISPVIKFNKLNPFAIPVFGMNYIRSGFDKSMYVLNDRKSDVNSFFESYAKSNKAFQDLLKEAKKGTGKEIKVPADFKNNTNEFIIGKGKADKKKTFNSLQELRTHLDDLINKGKITMGMTVKVYFICGDLSSLIDDDGDGVMDDKDDCPEEKGDLPNGCKKDEKEKPKPETGAVTTNNVCPSNVSIGTIMKESSQKNIIRWTSNNLNPLCKVVVSVFTVSNKKLIKSVTLPYNINQFEIPIEELYEKHPKIRKLECFVIVEIYCDFKSIAKKESDPFTLYCK